jgi:tetratricopeptide (TPR) repeat protein
MGISAMQFGCIWMALVVLSAGVIIARKLNTTSPPNGTVRRMFGEDVLLVTMVKDEERSIGRMLESSKQVATHWLICDTGSTDGTMRVVANTLGPQGSWVKRDAPFVNFEHNRNACLKEAGNLLKYQFPSVKWVLFMDADHVLVPSWEHGGTPPAHDVNYVAIRTQDGLYNVDNALPYLIRATILSGCKYRLYTHEILECAKEWTRGNYKGIIYIHNYWEGPASKSNKYERDARLLKQWLHEHGSSPDEADMVPRALFYLARSYQGAGNYSDAIETYKEHRAVEIYTNYWFYSTYSRAVCIHRLCGGENFTTCGYTMDQVEGAFLDAHNELDGYFRREPLFYLARMHASNGNYSRCLLYSTAAMFAPPIDHSRIPLFVERLTYDWALEEQHAACLEGLGRLDEAQAHYRKLLAFGSASHVGAEAIARIKAQLKD